MGYIYEGSVRLLIRKPERITCRNLTRAVASKIEFPVG